MASNEPKIHHYVPQFYLRRFASGKSNQLLCYKRGSTEPFLQGVHKAAAETGFYEVAELDGSITNRIELALGNFESEIAPLLDPIANGIIPERKHRLRLAMFIALQCARTKLSRDQYTATINAAMNEVVMDGIPSSEDVKARSASLGKPITSAEAQNIFEGLQRGNFMIQQHPNDHIRMMAGVAEKVAPYFVDRVWMILKSPGRDFITSDQPVSIFTPREFQKKFEGVGFANAVEVYWPVDPETTLLLCVKDYLKDGVDHDSVITVEDENVIYINDIVAGNSYQWIFQRPGGEDISSILPEGKTEMGQVNGKPYYLPFRARRRAKDI
ncbi:MAG: DUF4238 domain-containing protein [Chloroflexi bacterium]|nr:DUF4238 domain-containing protein [Chloroflexota bacterium]